jgi:hypothetical protein
MRSDLRVTREQAAAHREQILDAAGARSLLKVDFDDAQLRLAGKTTADIGGARGAFVFMNRVGPDCMMIVPVGQTERTAILSESQSLTEQLERAIGYQPPR